MSEEGRSEMNPETRSEMDPELSPLEFEEWLDEYLHGRLPDEEASKFEQYYFIHPDGFRKTAERSALLEAIRKEGPRLFISTKEAGPAARGRKLFGLLTPRGWIVAAILAVLALIVLWLAL
jgi:hypothetical protein